MIGKLLQKIKTPADLRQLTVDQLDELAEEIRHLIKASVGRNGGHLASNLGMVELTIALHCVFDFSSDRLVWDVGHQSYVHKILTGRAEQFENLRKKNGVSGFPNPEESSYDQFYVGHAGTAIACAVGLALGAQMTAGEKSEEKVVAVVGDASIVNGLSFEGLNNSTLLKRQMLIILNDNSMAIDKTQGAFAKYLTRVRVSRPYEDLQRRTELLMRHLPYFGDAIHDTIDRIKGGIKTTLLGRQKFQQLSIPFYGPIDGHNIANMIKILTALRDFDRPVILHVYTEKGRGFVPAIQDPRTFHSTQPFTVDGETVSFPERVDRSFTAVFTRSLSKLMAADKRIVALTAAMPDGTGLAPLRKSFPDRVIDVGIAESAAVDIAAGLAKSGLRPIVAIYSTFMQRCFDQIFQEVALQNLPVVLCMDRAGLVGGDGATHHGFCDITTTRCLPNMTLMAPMDANELTEALKFAVQSGLPCAIRYPRDRAEEVEQMAVDYHSPPFELGKAAWVRNGRDAVVLAYGNAACEALIAAETLAEEGIDLGVISARFAKPLDEKILHKLLADGHNMPIITMEENTLVGGFGSAVLEFAQQHRLDARKITRIGLPDRLIDQDTRQGQLEQVGLTRQNLIKQVRQLLNKDNDESNEKKTDCPANKPGQTPDHPGRTGTARMA